MEPRGISSVRIRTIQGVAIALGFFILFSLDFLLNIDIFFPLLVLLVLMGGLIEYYNIIKKRKSRPFVITGIICGVLYYWLFWTLIVRTQQVGERVLKVSGKFASWSEIIFKKLFPSVYEGSASNAYLMSVFSLMLTGILISVIVILMVFFIKRLLSKNRPHFKDVLYSVFGLCYVIILGSFLLIHRYFFLKDDFRMGLLTVFLFLLVVKGCDASAYMGGKFLGKHKMASKISPNKTWEGAIAGMVFSLIVPVGFFLSGVIFENIWGAIVYGLVVGVFAQLGDLAESKIKRSSQVADSGKLLPFMGGVLDTIDSILLAAPISFVLLYFFSIFK